MKVSKIIYSSLMVLSIVSVVIATIFFLNGNMPYATYFMLLAILTRLGTMD